MSHQYEYPRPAVSADVVVLDRRTEQPKILLIQRLHEPFAGQWALPGGFLEMDETLESAAIRELQEETGLIVSQVRQIGAFSAVHRDPRGRVITVAYWAELNDGQTALAADDAKSVHWFELDALPPLAFDHAEIIALGLEFL
jgi:8-oxo-dGTP diphosphatase